MVSFVSLITKSFILHCLSTVVLVCGTGSLQNANVLFVPSLEPNHWLHIITKRARYKTALSRFHSHSTDKGDFINKETKWSFTTVKKENKNEDEERRGDALSPWTKNGKHKDSSVHSTLWHDLISYSPPLRQKISGLMNVRVYPAAGASHSTRKYALLWRFVSQRVISRNFCCKVVLDQTLPQI